MKSIAYKQMLPEDKLVLDILAALKKFNDSKLSESIKRGMALKKASKK